jgi:AraC-like DNA-binding protein
VFGRILHVSDYREFIPCLRLARYVECYWSQLDLNGTSKHRVLPDGCVDILFSSRDGEPLSLELVGLMTAAKTFNVKPRQSFFGIRFRPGMAAAFVPEAAQLNDKTEPLENLTFAGAGQLLEQFAESQDSAEMSRLMDGLLRPLEPIDANTKALRQLANTQLSLDTFARETGLSTRHLRRVCLDRAGVSPKYLMRILRFRKAAERLAGIAASPAQPNWADVAVGCGYYDQAHFIREFQEFTGHTPGRYLQSLAHADP